MQTNIPEKLLMIVDEMDPNGSANLTRLTILKKWLERPERLSAFAIWVAAGAVSRKSQTTAAEAERFQEASEDVVRFGQSSATIGSGSGTIACGIFKTNTKINDGGHCEPSGIGTLCWWRRL